MCNVDTKHLLQYRDERDLPTVMDLIDNELSEPYSIFTYRSRPTARMLMVISGPPPLALRQALASACWLVQVLPAQLATACVPGL